MKKIREYLIVGIGVIKEASGEYITFVDADDFVGETYILYIYNFLIDNNVDIAITRNLKYRLLNDNIYELLDIKTCKDIYDKKINILQFWQNKGFINHEVSNIYSTNIIKKNNILFNEQIRLGEDFLFLVEYIYCIKDCKIIVSSEAYKYYYRQHDINTVKNGNISSDIFLLYDNIEAILKHKGFFKNQQAIKYFLRNKLHTIYYIYRITKSYDFIFLKKMFKEIEKEETNLAKDDNYYKRLKKYKKRKYLEYLKYFLKLLKNRK